MMRISIDDGPQSLTLRLEGKLAGPWVGEAARAWSEVTRSCHTGAVTVDLSDVTFVDESGRKLLDQMFRQGAQLRDARLLTKYILDQVIQGAKQPAAEQSSAEQSTKNGG